MSIENIVKEIVTSGGHNPDDKSIVDNVTPQGRDTVAGMKPITIRIPDDRLRSNRITLRHNLVKAFRSAGLDPKDANVKESILPIEVKEAAVDLEGTKYRIYFKKSGKQTPPTAEDESLVCYALSARQKKGKAITAQDLIGTFDDVHADKTLEECIERLPDDWLDSAIDRANGLFKSKFAPKRGSHFHRGSKEVKQLGEVFKKVRKTYMDGKFTNLDINKWNPSDIWISNGMIKFNKDNYEEVAQINLELEKRFVDRSFYGVSLKKSTGDVTYEHVPAAKELPKDQRPKVSIKKTMSQTFKEFNDIQVKFVIDYGGKEVEIQFRTFGGDTHQGNITKFSGQSSQAVHGKIAPYDAYIPTSVISTFKSDHGEPLKRLGDFKNIKESYERKNLLQQQAFSDYAAMATGFLMTLDKRGKPKDWDEGGFENHKAGLHKGRGFASKVMGLQLAAMVKIMTNEQKGDFFRSVIAYASSRIPGLSSVHIKNK